MLSNIRLKTFSIKCNIFTLIQIVFKVYDLGYEVLPSLNHYRVKIQ